MTALGALGSRLESLRALGAHIDYADPRVPQITVGGHRLEAVAWEQADLGVLMLRLTAHAEFDPKRLVSDAWLVVDTRYATGALGEFPHVVRL